MAISHINGIAVSTLSHIDGVSKSTVTAINGITAGFTPPRAPNTYAPVFCCGFECGQAGSVGQHWQAGSGTAPTFNTSTVRSGTRSVRCNPSGANSQFVCVAASNSMSVGRVYVRFATLPSTDVFLVWANESGASAARLGIGFKQSDSKIYAACGTATNAPSFGATGFAVTTGTWYRIDFKLDFTARAADGQVDGNVLAQKTTTGSGSMVDLRIGAFNANTSDIYYDDFVLSNTSADYPLGAGYVNHFIPVSDGTHNIAVSGDFKKGDGTNISNATTDSWQLIDEVPLDDTTPDANDFIGQTVDSGGGSEYVEHVFGPASGISTPTSGPRAVEVIYAYHAAGTASGGHTSKINDNGTENTVNAFSAAGATTIRYGRKHYANAPSDSNAWGVASGAGNFNDLRHRFGYSTDANPDQYLDCVMIEAEFA